MAYRELDEFDLRLKEDDEILLLEGRQLLRRALNGARAEVNKRHLEAKNAGQLIRVFKGHEDEVKDLLREAAIKALAPSADEN